MSSNGLHKGDMTPIYIDLRRIISSPRTLRMTAQALCEIIIAKGLNDILDIPMLMKRKETKSYGARKAIEGVFTPGNTVLLIEDVVTSGESSREIAEALREEGLKVADSVAVLGRQQGAIEGLAKADINFYSALTMDLILDGMISKNEITVERKHEIVEHLKKPFKKA
ncbi:unnamed protein product [Heligmosomoides polygyrus]|uniref:Pribosyltran domain-containing protein n=1 Tax=Heligmosomoides polygyrus TaxID=6339 RepID=A0A183FJK1_HELPZ|nr:unnamed protein product [Heligmosomoides polygyrus]